MEFSRQEYWSGLPSPTPRDLPDPRIFHFLHWQVDFSLVAQLVEYLSAIQGTQVCFLIWEDFLKKEKATHSRIFAWKTSQTEEHGRLQSMDSQSPTHWASEQCHLGSPTNILTMWKVLCSKLVKICFLKTHFYLFVLSNYLTWFWYMKYFFSSTIMTLFRNSITFCFFQFWCLKFAIPWVIFQLAPLH